MGTLAAGIFAQLILRRLQSWLGRFYRAETTEARLVATAVQTKTTEAFAYTQEPPQMIWSGLRAVNLGVPAGDSGDLARGYVTLGIVTSVIPLAKLTRELGDHSVAMAERLDRPYEVGYCRTRRAASACQAADWERVVTDLDAVDEIAERLKSRRMQAEGGMIRGLMLLFRGRWEEATPAYERLWGLVEHSKDVQSRVWALAGLGWSYLKTGRLDEAEAALTAAKGLFTESSMTPDLLMVHGADALLAVARDDLDAAETSARELERLTKKEPPVAYWVVLGLGAAADVWLALLERGRTTALPHAKYAVKMARGFGKKFPLGRAAAHLWDGILAARTGAADAAQKSLGEALAVAEVTGVEFVPDRARAELSAK